VLNYAFVMTVPSWCNEKRRSSNVNKVVWSSVSISTMFFLLVAILGAFAFPNLDGEVKKEKKRASAACNDLDDFFPSSFDRTF
jgi:amino acid permease